jgi:hypothetical protein
MAHPPFWPFLPKSNGFSVSPVSKGEKTAKIRPFSAVKQLRWQRWHTGFVYFALQKNLLRGGLWSKIRAEGYEVLTSPSLGFK